MRALAPTLPIAAALLGALPLLSGRAPWGHDSHMHLQRIAALHAALLSGNLYPRWFEGFFYAYGYPVLHFYAPLVYYLGALFRLGGAEVPMAFNLIVLTARLVGAVGAYLLGRRLLGSRWAGLVVGTGFALLPYQLTEIYVRAALAELVALNLLPWALWAAERVCRGGCAPGRGAALAGALVALLVLVHQTTALVTTSTVAAFAGARALRLGAPGRSVGWLAVAAGLAAALSAFFWLPVVLDAGLVHLEAQPPGFPPFVGHLLPPERLVQGTPYATYAWPEVIRLPRVELLAVGLGAVALAGVPGRTRRPLLVALALWATAAFGMTTLAQPLWEALPAAQLMQYPWRLRIVTTLATALLIGGLASLRWRPAGTALGVLVLGLVAWASLADWRTPWLELGRSAFEPGAFARYELVPFYPETGTTVPAQFLPSTVALRQEELKRPRAGPAPPQPELAAEVRVVGRGPTALRLRTDAPEPFRLRYHQFHFPGWRATLDGSAVLPVGPDGERGLVSVEVPAGSHELELRWQDDPRWSAAALLSGLGLVAAVGLAAGPVRSRAGIVAGALTLGLLVAGAAVGPRLAAGLVPPAAPAAVFYPGGLSLTGWSATVGRGTNHATARPAGYPAPEEGQVAVLDVELYWLARREPTEDHRVELRLLDGAGEERAVYHRPPNWGATPTSTWSRGELVRDRHRLPLPPGLTAGRYELEVGLGGGPGRVVGVVDLPGTPAEPAPNGEREAIRFANGLALVAWRTEPDDPSRVPALAPGGKLRVWLTWQVRDEVPHDAATSVFLADHRGGKHALNDSYPPHDLEFTASWLRGSRHEQSFELAVDERLAAGLYRLSVELYDYANGVRVPLQEQGATRALLRLYRAAGQPANGRGVRFRDGIVLEEHAVRLTDDALEVDLRWAAAARPGGDYTVFLHLYDAGGKLVAQEDSPPLEGAYPTWAWDAGEAIGERRRVRLPAGGLPTGATLKVGMYLLASGERLPTAEGGDGVQLGLPGG